MVKILRPLLRLLSIAGVWLGISDSCVIAQELSLFDLVKNGDVEAVEQLLKSRIDVNIDEPDGATALHWAAYLDDLEMVQSLVRSGADVNAANDYGVTPLTLACGNASDAVVRFLLGTGADPNSLVWSGETVLMTCARTGAYDAVNTLLQAGASVNSVEPEEHQTALMWAVSERHFGVARELVSWGATVDARSKRGFTPLLFAAREGDIESARLLLAAGANPNDSAFDGTSALVVATVRGHTTLAIFLLEAGADPNHAGRGYSALHWASGLWETELTGVAGIAVERDEEWRSLAGIQTEKTKLVRALLEYGAHIDSRVKQSPRFIGFGGRGEIVGATPFFLAAMAADVPLMRLLVEYGADPHRRNLGNVNSLMVAAGLGRRARQSSVSSDRSLAAAKFVWNWAGGDMNAVSDAGDTAVHGAANSGSPELVQFLVDNGAAVDVANNRGTTPLMVAAGTEVEGLLRELVKDANVSAATRVGR